MKLPNAERAVIDMEKLHDYCLNSNHPKGKYKARVFLEKLELKADDVERLREMVLEAISQKEAMAKDPSTCGQRFYVDFGYERRLLYVVMQASVRSVWMIRNDEAFPRLTSCFILQRRF
jgi:hypothetical protein